MKYRIKTGFTLVEIIVATGIFAMLLTIFVGIFGRFVAVQERGTHTQIVLEQLRLALEVMNRELRTGFGATYTLADGQGKGVLLRNQDGLCVAYRWIEGRLERSEAQVAGTSCSPSNFSGAKYASLTGNDVVITNVRFDVTPSQVESGVLKNQGTVTTILQAQSALGDTLPVRLQSTVTSRQVIPYVQQ